MLSHVPTLEERAAWEEHVKRLPQRVRKTLRAMPPWRVLECTLPNGTIAWGVLSAVNPDNGNIDIDVLLSIGHAIDAVAGLTMDKVKITEGEDVVGDDMRVATHLYRMGRIN